MDSPLPVHEKSQVNWPTPFRAGNGIASFALASSGWSVVSLEPDPSTRVGAGAIRTIAAEAELPIEICEAATLPLPFPDGTFDIRPSPLPEN